MADLPRVVAQLPLAPRAAEVIDGLLGAPMGAYEEEGAGGEQENRYADNNPDCAVNVTHTRLRLPLWSFRSKRRYQENGQLSERRGHEMLVMPLRLYLLVRPNRVS